MAKVRKIRGAYVLDYTDLIGRRIRRVSPFSTKKQSEAHLREILDRQAKGALDGDRIRFKKYAEDWLARRQPHLKPGTWTTYKGQIKHHLLSESYGLGQHWLTRITRPACEEFKTKMRAANPKLTPRTINAVLTLLGTILQDAMKDGLIYANPARLVDKLPGKQREMDFLTAQEVKLLLAAPMDDELKLIIRLAVTTGMRRGEILGLRWEDLDFQRKQIHVRQNYFRGRIQTPKSAASRRKITVIPADTFRELRRWRAARGNPRGDELVFDRGDGHPPDPTRLSKERWNSALAVAGLRESLRFHDLRHSYASLLLAQGESMKLIQSQLGHSSIMVTMDRYAHLLPETAEEAAERLGAFLGGAAPQAARSERKRWA